MHEVGEDKASHLHYAKVDNEVKPMPRIEINIGKNKVTAFKNKLYFDFWPESSDFKCVDIATVTKEAEEEKIEVKEEKAESIQIKKNKDGEVIANAFVTPEKISIILNEGIGLTDEIPPLRSLFIERIIGEMKKIDSTDVKNGKIDENSVIDCIINKNGPAIREIIIKNYRQKERLDEIINTATWSLTRMLENSVK